VIMIGDHPGRLIESTLITSLNPPAAGDFSWVKPGKSAWDWWNGPSLSGVAKAGMNDETMKAFINFAAENGLEYMLIDDGWYVNSGGGGGLFPGADNMRAVPELNLSELVRYAAQRKVGIWVWVHWKLMDANMDVSLPHYAKLGIKGVKVDFMDRHDQQMVDFYLRLIRTAAANKLMIDLHGAYPPTGLIRTYPNYITQEGVLGAEYNKWSRRITATHNVTLPFTRGLLGPYDYTPGGFGNATPETFVIQNLLPMVQTTRGHGLAMYVVYDSPFQGVSDSPDRYRNQPGLDFIKLVPAAWDETRVLSGAIGEYVVIARRKGKDWFVGAMTNEQARTIEVPLTFLEGRAEATIWRDGADPTALVTDKRAVSAADTLSLPLAGSGGAAIMLKRK
jgi:alpha-glucosidase